MWNPLCPSPSSLPTLHGAGTSFPMTCLLISLFSGIGRGGVHSTSCTHKEPSKGPLPVSPHFHVLSKAHRRDAARAHGGLCEVCGSSSYVRTSQVTSEAICEESQLCLSLTQKCSLFLPQPPLNSHPCEALDHAVPVLVASCYTSSLPGKITSLRLGPGRWGAFCPSSQTRASKGWGWGQDNPRCPPTLLPSPTPGPTSFSSSLCSCSV